MDSKVFLDEIWNYINTLPKANKNELTNKVMFITRNNNYVTPSPSKLTSMQTRRLPQNIQSNFPVTSSWLPHVDPNNWGSSNWLSSHFIRYGK